MGIDNIFQAKGFGIAITGLTIVFVALVLISVFIALLPRLMEALSIIFPEEHAAPAPATRAGVDEELVAAIGFAMHQRKRNKPPK